MPSELILIMKLLLITIVIESRKLYICAGAGQILQEYKKIALLLADFDLGSSRKRIHGGALVLNGGEGEQQDFYIRVEAKYEESIDCTTAIINSVNLMVTAIAFFDELTNYIYGRVHVTDERIRNDKYLRITINKNQPTTARDSREYQNSIIKLVN
uniref:Uncharacterized protein n=1 Tax=Glossina palpalis gambiensis TaxID=67801 RepID=A0A1B0BT86_9MUSC